MERNKSKKELIIESFQKMDINMLDILLDEDKTYQDASKGIFLEKIEEAFLKFKENGDTYLILHKGLCHSNECTNNGCSGYSFVGNASKDHMDLIFIEKADEIMDIFHCSSFEPIEKPTDTRNLLSIHVYNDEKADFKPSDYFLIRNQKCVIALAELNQYRNNAIDKTICIPWLAKHRTLYNSFDLPPFFHSNYYNFFKLYNTLKHLYHYLHMVETALAGIFAYPGINDHEEVHLLRWLTKYEKAGVSLSRFSGDLLEAHKTSSLKIDTTDFEYIEKFKALFDDVYWNMLEKYVTISADESSTQYVNEFGEIFDCDDSLTYHLNKRKII